MQKDESTFSHLTLDDRCAILAGIRNDSSKSDIAKVIGKDKSTVGKEIRLHRRLSYKCKLPLECAAYRVCTYNRQCNFDCPEYVPFQCARRDRSPGTCDGCSNWNKCHFDKFTYSPIKAQHEYEMTLVDSRRGVNLTTSEAKELAELIGPLLKQGLSPYQILQIHPEINLSEKTLYNYIEGEIFHEISGITVMNLRRQVSRKISKQKSVQYKKRMDRKFLNGRTYADYQTFMNENPNVFVTDMDTVYNDVSNGPFIQTFLFREPHLLFALFQTERTEQSMTEGVNLLEKILGPDVFQKYVHVLLTDRGSEFYAADAMETSEDGSRRTRVFYCDPMSAGQKGTLENCHIELRYIFPKSVNLFALGLTSQEDLNLALSHLNSAPIEKLGGKSPLDLADFMFHDLYERLYDFGVRPIEKDQIILEPYLMQQ